MKPVPSYVPPSTTWSGGEGPESPASTAASPTPSLPTAVPTGRALGRRWSSACGRRTGSASSSGPSLGSETHCGRSSPESSNAAAGRRGRSAMTAASWSLTSPVPHRGSTISPARSGCDRRGRAQCARSRSRARERSARWRVRCRRRGPDDARCGPPRASAFLAVGTTLPPTVVSAAVGTGRYSRAQLVQSVQ